MNQEKRLEFCRTGLINRDGEQWRHECECRYVARLPDNARRSVYLAGVQRKRGSKAAELLRNDTWAWMKEQQ